MAVVLRRPVESRWASAPVLALAASLMGVVVGFGVTVVGPILILMAGAGLLLVGATLRTIWAPVAALVAVVTILPFFVIPISAGGAQPTLFEIAAIGAITACLIVVLIDRREQLVVGPDVLFWGMFTGYLVFAFLLGTRYDAGLDLVRLFGRFLLAISLFWLTIQLLRTHRDAHRLITWIVGGCTFGAAIGLALYAGGASLTFRVLSTLIPYGYPDTRIVRFIEDNPNNAMRAVGAGVDPNAFGGMLMLGFVLATGLLFSRSRRSPMLLHLTAVGVIGLAMLLTFSRGAWIGGMVGFAIIVWYRARYLIPVGIGLGVTGLAIGVGATFVQRLEAGLRLEDAATLQRLVEYENALGNIRAQPWFGIGFGDGPSPDQAIGVSSIYLLIAEQTGLVGLALFALFSGVVVVRAWNAFRRTDDDLILTTGAAFVAALTVGFVDHYFFNIRFVHTVGLFWMVVGLVVALTNIASRTDVERGHLI